MASAFWTVEDGSTLARNWGAMAAALKVISEELATMKGAEEFATYVEAFVFQEGDESNGYGGLWRRGESIMFNFDLRAFAPPNRAYFWQATQRALAKLKPHQEG